MQVGYPSRDPIIKLLLKAIAGKISVGNMELHVKLEIKEARDRASAALTTLFEAAADVHRAMDAHDRRTRSPVLMFDEVHDLIRNDRLRADGGKYIFQLLGTSFVSCGTDQQRVRIIATGSSYEFAQELELLTPLVNTRSRAVLLGDPTPEAMMQALRTSGYTEAEAAGMVQLCGTRLRLFEEALSGGPSAVSYDAFVASHCTAASTSIKNLLNRMPTPEAKAQLSAVLDAILKADDNAAAPRPEVSHLPVALADAPHALVLFSTHSQLYFQSVLVRNMWKSHQLESGRQLV